VLERLDVEELEDGEIARDGARLAIRVDRFEPGVEAAAPAPVETRQLSLFEAEEAPAAPSVPALPPLEPTAVPPERVRRLSYSALALYERCPYRFYAERLVGLRPVAASGWGGGVGDGHGEPALDAASPGLAASEVGDAVHKLLERVDLAARNAARGARWRRLRAAVRVRARRRPLPRRPRRLPPRGRAGARRRLQVEPARRADARRGGRRRVPAPAARVRDRVLPRRRRRGRGRLPVPRASR